MESNEGPGQGKKVFLLYPHSVIREEMLDILIMTGYETYTLLDENRARKLLEKFPGSIMFINIDEGLSEAKWEAYIRGIMDDPAVNTTRLGIMSYNQDKVLMQKYLMELAISCGYVQLKLGIRESTGIILAALEANEARGRRKHLRAECADDINAVLNYQGDSGLHHGRILDISSAGVAARFEHLEALAVNSVMAKVQLKLRGGLIMTDMIFMGKRLDDRSVSILLFDPKMKPENKLIVHRYIKLRLQKYIDSLDLGKK